MKNFFLLPILFFTLSSTAQNISGLYMGTLVNDSTGQRQNYEFALSEYRGKITGYSYTTFTVNDTFYYGIRRIKASILKDELVVEDVKMLANNFPESPAKGVKKINNIPLNGQDSVVDLKGRWRTTQTKVYYALHGNLDMKREADSSQSSLIKHLIELNIIENPSANKDNYAWVEAKNLPAAERAVNILKTIDVTADSLVLSFYDNGVVDGDVISVLLNEENILLNNKLTGVATKKVIHLKSLTAETLQLTLVAETLGSIPPNTGLLIVQDGKERYEIHFSADMQTNAAVVFRKKKKS